MSDNRQFPSSGRSLGYVPDDPFADIIRCPSLDDDEQIIHSKHSLNYQRSERGSDRHNQQFHSYGIEIEDNRNPRAYTRPGTAPKGQSGVVSDPRYQDSVAYSTSLLSKQIAQIQGSSSDNISIETVQNICDAALNVLSKVQPPVCPPEDHHVTTYQPNVLESHQSDFRVQCSNHDPASEFSQTESRSQYNRHSWSNSSQLDQYNFSSQINTDSRRREHSGPLYKDTARSEIIKTGLKHHVPSHLNAHSTEQISTHQREYILSARSREYSQSIPLHGYRSLSHGVSSHPDGYSYNSRVPPFSETLPNTTRQSLLPTVSSYPDGKSIYIDPNCTPHLRMTDVHNITNRQYLHINAQLNRVGRYDPLASNEHNSQPRHEGCPQLKNNDYLQRRNKEQTHLHQRKEYRTYPYPRCEDQSGHSSYDQQISYNYNNNIDQHAGQYQNPTLLGCYNNPPDIIEPQTYYNDKALGANTNASSKGVHTDVRINQVSSQYISQPADALHVSSNSTITMKNTENMQICSTRDVPIGSRPGWTSTSISSTYQQSDYDKNAIGKQTGAQSSLNKEQVSVMDGQISQDFGQSRGRESAKNSRAEIITGLHMSGCGKSLSSDMRDYLNNNILHRNKSSAPVQENMRKTCLDEDRPRSPNKNNEVSNRSDRSRSPNKNNEVSSRSDRSRSPNKNNEVSNRSDRSRSPNKNNEVSNRSDRSRSPNKNNEVSNRSDRTRSPNKNNEVSNRSDRSRSPNKNNEVSNRSDRTRSPNKNNEVSNRSDRSRSPNKNNEVSNRSDRSRSPNKNNEVSNRSDRTFHQNRDIAVSVSDRLHSADNMGGVSCEKRPPECSSSRDDLSKKRKRPWYHQARTRKALHAKSANAREESYLVSKQKSGKSFFKKSTSNSNTIPLGVTKNRKYIYDSCSFVPQEAENFELVYKRVMAHVMDKHHKNAIVASCEGLTPFVTTGKKLLPWIKTPSEVIALSDSDGNDAISINASPEDESSEDRITEKNVHKAKFQSFSKLGRKWIQRPRPTYIKANLNTSLEFTVASYNILADSVLEHQGCCYERKMKESNFWLFNWEYRKQNLLEEMVFANADVRKVLFFLCYLLGVINILVSVAHVCNPCRQGSN